MVTRYRVALDDKQLDAVASGIIILDISYGAPAMQHAASALAARNGMVVQNTTYGTGSVTVTFEIHEADVKKRQDVCKRIQAWANGGGWLTTNDRGSQRLRVKCSVLPSINSAMRWTEKLSMVFTAYEQPLWEDMYATSAVLKEGETTKTLYVEGTAPETTIEASILNAGDANIDSLKVYAGNSYMEFESLALAPGERLAIGHDERGILYIRADGMSRMDRRTAASSDELTILCGEENRVSYEADGTAEVTMTARGRYV